jgi:hypothetical protein
MNGAQTEPSASRGIVGDHEQRPEEAAFGLTRMVLIPTADWTKMLFEERVGRGNRPSECNVNMDRLSGAAWAQVRVGRIVEVRPRRLADRSDVESLKADVFAALQRAGPRAVICADYRGAKPLSEQMANAWSRAMRCTNPAIARSVLLLNPSNTIFNLQLERVVHCAGTSTRRLFADIDELRRWVEGDLTQPERDALRAFLGDDNG